jgi:hypothetical protein
MFGLLIDDLLGRAAGPIPELSGAAGATFLTLPAGGTVTSIEGWEAVSGHESVVAADLRIRVGDTLTPATGSYDRPAVIVVAAPSLVEVEAITEQLTAELVVSSSTGRVATGA